MNIFQRQQRQEVDSLVEEYTQQGMSRRVFMQRAMAAGLTASSASALLAACGGANPTGSGSNNSNNTNVPKASSVDLLTLWGGTELDAFNQVIAPFKSQKKIDVRIESSRDQDAILTSRIRGNNPPDIAILPNPGKMQQLAQQNHLIKMDSFLNMDTVRKDYAKAWIDLGSYNNSFYALFYKAANKGTIWYSPNQFKAAGYSVPQTWNDLLSLSDKIAQSGKYPWSMGVESSASSGWPATDWIAEIYLNKHGPDMYDKWTSHKIPWTDSSIKDSFQEFGKIVTGNHYVNGGPQSILATNFQPASYAPFNNPPQAYMYYLGDFTAGFITKQFSSAKAGSDFDFFAFPTINTQYKGAVTGGADVVVALKDNTAVRDLISYLATASAQEIWVKQGGFTSPNKSVNLSAYPDDVSRKSAQMLTSASTFRFGAGDLMPPAVQQQFWKGMLTYIGDTNQLDSVLSGIESVAQQAYTS